MAFEVVTIFHFLQKAFGFGSRIPVLMAKEFDPELRNPVLNDGDVVRMFEELGRNKGVVDGFDNLRLSFGLLSFSFSRDMCVDLFLEVADSCSHF